MVLAVALCLLQVGTPDLPLIATVGGIRLGVTTVEGFEKAHGKGRAQTGGHPRGARVWYLPSLKAELYGDGFHYGPNGRVFDEVAVAFAQRLDKRLPRLRLDKSELGLLGLLSGGMSRSEVQRALGTSQRVDEVTMIGLVKYREPLVNKSGEDRFTTWTATFNFGKRGLEGFKVVAD